MSSRTRRSSILSSSSINRITTLTTRITTIRTRAILTSNRPPLPASPARRLINSRQIPHRKIRQNNIQRAQILPQAKRAIPLTASPIRTTSRALRATGTLRRSALSGLLQDKINSLVRRPRRNALFWRRVEEGGEVAAVRAFGVGEESALRVRQEVGLREGAGEDGAESELVDVAVVARLAGNFDEGAVGGAVGGVGEGFVDGWDEAVVEHVVWGGGLWGLLVVGFVQGWVSERGGTHVIVHVCSAGEVGAGVRGPLDVVHGASAAVLARVEAIVHRTG